MGSSHGIGVKRNDYHRRNRRRNISMHKHSHGTNVGETQLTRIANMQIDVPKLDRNVLVREASHHYNKIHARPQDTPISYDEPIERICVNYIRHKLTDYEVTIHKAGYEAYLLFSQKVFDTIKSIYAWLSVECDNQLSERLRTKYKANGVRLVKGGRLTSEHVADFNAKEETSFSCIKYKEEFTEDEEVRYFQDQLNSLDAQRFLYLPPFLKPEEIRNRRFSGEMNDDWWRWEHELGLSSDDGRPQNWREG
jgi:hypothetical protein